MPLLLPQAVAKAFAKRVATLERSSGSARRAVTCSSLWGVLKRSGTRNALKARYSEEFRRVACLLYLVVLGSEASGGSEIENIGHLHQTTLAKTVQERIRAEQKIYFEEI